MKTKLCYLFLLLCLFQLQAQDRNGTIDTYLLGQVQSNYLDQKDIIDYKITDKSSSRKSGVQHFYFRQSHLGVEIIGTESSIHITNTGKVIASNHKFVANKLNKLQVSSRRFSFNQAIQQVALKMNYQWSGTLQSINRDSNADVKIFKNSSLSQRDIPVKKVFYVKSQGSIVPAWEISIYEPSGENWYNFILDDATGTLLFQNNWRAEHASEDYELPKGKLISVEELHVNPLPLDNTCTYNVFALPKATPFSGGRSLEVDPHSLTASPFGWHDTDGIAGPEYTVTRGNNVNAYENGDNVGYQPDGGPSLNFDFPFNPVYSSVNQSEDAAITNLFYWNNIIHDVMYEYGFDEASGNFQQTNYSGQGLGNDHVLAFAQDDIRHCNANFYTPPEGNSAIMQLFTCGERDGDFDNIVIIHEYAHGISNRLTGGASNTDCLSNSEQMGEGWSDWYAMLLTMTPSDVVSDQRPIGNWLAGQEEDGPGIREYPYTTDLGLDPRTYDYIKTSYGAHNLGSVWAAMLWELTWGLIEVHGFDADVYNGTGGNNIALALVTEGLKLQPCNPGFVDGRDAILAADMALYGGANQCVIWEAFAKRGLGLSADQGTSSSVLDGTEAFDTLDANIILDEESFCELENTMTLSGGYPQGGVYSGPGVTDLGDGINFTFNPSIAGVGVHTINYDVNTVCSGPDTGTTTIEVTSNIPEITCQDITVALDENDTAIIVPEDVVSDYPSIGYTIDQNGIFSPEDISSIGTPINLGFDDMSPEFAIGFPFTFYGITYSSFKMSTNGFITFDTAIDNTGCCVGQILPNPEAPNNLIALAWGQLGNASSADIKYATIGSAPNRILVLDIVDMPSCCLGPGTRVTSQLKLFEGSNRIEIHSADASGSLMTQGIENIDGTQALTVDGRNTAVINLSNDFVAFVPNSLSFPDNCGLEATVTLDVNTFDCSNIGENVVTATVTDANGNSNSCNATVTIVPHENPQFSTIETSLCVDGGVVTGLTGGTPEGGIYSGVGITDDGNGQTFSLDPNLMGEGIHTISYELLDSCGGFTTATIDVEIAPAISNIECRDVSLTLDAEGNASIQPEDVVFNIASGTVYTLTRPYFFSPNIRRYDYDRQVEDLSLDTSYFGMTSITLNYTMDQNPRDGEVYIISQDNGNAPRSLYQYNIEVSNGLGAHIADIVSVSGNPIVSSMTFANNGMLYILFTSGEINSFNLETQEMTYFATVVNVLNGGLTYDFDNNRLIHSTGVIPTLTAIDVETAAVTTLFSIETGCGAEALEYVGNNKLLVGARSGCEKLYMIDLELQTSEDIWSQLGIYPEIVDILFIAGEPVDSCNESVLALSLSQETFDCTNVGSNEVLVTATDANGYSTTCSFTVTVEDPNNDCSLSINDIDKEKEIIIYPNPVEHMLTVQWKDTALQALKLYDISGRLVLEQDVGTSANEVQLDISPFSDGVYLLKIQSQDGISTKRIVKKRN